MFIILNKYSKQNSSIANSLWCLDAETFFFLNWKQGQEIKVGTNKLDSKGKVLEKSPTRGNGNFNWEKKKKKRKKTERVQI